MALVVLLRGVNVGGHRTFRPAALAKQLTHLDTMNIGAAGTLVVRRPITRTRLRAELSRRLPFDTHIMICEGREILTLLSRDHFAGQRERHDVIRFLSVLARKPRGSPSAPISIPPRGTWMVKVLATDGRFVVGLHRRQMKAIGYLGKLDGLFGAAATTRSWSTIAAIGRVLTEGDADS